MKLIILVLVLALGLNSCSSKSKDANRGTSSTEQSELTALENSEAEKTITEAEKIAEEIDQEDPWFKMTPEQKAEYVNRPVMKTSGKKKEKNLRRTIHMVVGIAPFLKSVFGVMKEFPTMKKTLSDFLKLNTYEVDGKFLKIFPRKKKVKYTKINICYTVGGVAGFHLNDDEWNEHVIQCEKKFKTVLTPEQIQILRDELYKIDFKNILAGTGEFEREDKTLAKLCAKNPLSMQIFSEEQQNFYCTMNLRFRGCNITNQRIYGNSRRAAFERCAQTRQEGFAFDNHTYSEYERIMGDRYLQDLDSLRYICFGKKGEAYDKCVEENTVN